MQSPSALALAGGLRGADTSRQWLLLLGRSLSAAVGSRLLPPVLSVVIANYSRWIEGSEPIFLGRAEHKERMGETRCQEQIVIAAQKKAPCSFLAFTTAGAPRRTNSMKWWTELAMSTDFPSTEQLGTPFSHGEKGLALNCTQAFRFSIAELQLVGSGCSHLPLSLLTPSAAPQFIWTPTPFQVPCFRVNIFHFSRYRKQKCLGHLPITQEYNEDFPF